MISYNEIIEILNSAEKKISDCLAYLRDNKNTIIFKDYEDNYYNHLNNQYADVNRRTFLLKDVDFNSFFDITLSFLSEQSDFINDFKELEYLKTENNKLSKYAEKIISECMRSVQQYNYLSQNNCDIFHILYKPNLRANYSSILILKDFYKYEENIVLIGGNGSGKTSFANTLKGNFNPGTFVEAMNKAGGFDSGGKLYWANVRKVVPNFVYDSSSKQTLSGLSRAAKLKAINNKISQSNTYCVVEVKGGQGQHWVAIDSVNGTNIKMLDPGSKATNLWKEYDYKRTSMIQCFKKK